MYVHLGGDITVKDSDIVTIIDLEILSAQSSLNDYIRAEDDYNRLEYITGDISKSLVIAFDKTYVSPLSSTVILKRLKSLKYD